VELLSHGDERVDHRQEEKSTWVTKRGDTWCIYNGLGGKSRAANEEKDYFGRGRGGKTRKKNLR